MTRAAALWSDRGMGIGSFIGSGIGSGVGQQAPDHATAPAIRAARRARTVNPARRSGSPSSRTDTKRYRWRGPESLAGNTWHTPRAGLASRDASSLSGLVSRPDTPARGRRAPGLFPRRFLR